MINGVIEGNQTNPIDRESCDPVVGQEGIESEVNHGPGFSPLF